jgi:hypothetical protein
MREFKGSSEIATGFASSLIQSTWINLQKLHSSSRLDNETGGKFALAEGFFFTNQKFHSIYSYFSQ